MTSKTKPLPHQYKQKEKSYMYVVTKQNHNLTSINKKKSHTCMWLQQ